MGREQEFAELDRLFAEQSDGLPMVLVTGMAGIGKSELALQYAITKRPVFTGGIAQLSAKKFVDDLWDFLVFLQGKGMVDPRSFESEKMKAQYCWREWQEFCGPLRKALVVIDDVSHFATEVEKFLPPEDNEYSTFSILLTSRERQDDFEPLELFELDEEAAIKVFSQAVGTKQKHRLEGEMAIAHLCERLGNLPLALVLAGSWLGVANEERTIRDLEVSLQAKGLDAEPLQKASEKDRQSQRDRQNKGLKAAFELSWEQLENLGSAQQLARVLSLLEPNQIDWEWVEAVATAYPVEPPTIEPPPKSFWGNFFGDRSPQVPELKWGYAKIENLLTARNWLCSTSLLQEIEPNKSYRIHSLLHTFFTEQWQKTSDKQGWQLAFVEVFSERAKKCPNNAPWDVVEALQPLRGYFQQAIRIAEVTLSELENMELKTRLREQRNEIQAGDFWLNQVPLFARTFQTAQENHKRAKNSFSENQYTQGQEYQNFALEKYKEVIEQCRQVYPNSLVLAGYLNKIARFYLEIGYYEKGIKPVAEALDIAQEEGANKKLIASFTNDLAILHHYSGEYEAAESLYLEALQMMKELLGDRHPDVATSMNNLAALYKSQGKYEAAQPLFLDAIQMLKELLGDRHPYVATSMNNLAGLYKFQGKYEAAEPLYLDALQMTKELLGDRHPDVATSMNNLAFLYQSQGKYEAAEPLFLDALQMLKELLGDRHLSMATSMNNLAHLYYSQGRYEAAEPLFLDAFQMTKELLGDRHSDVARSMNNLAGLYESQGKYEAAEPLLIDALQMTKELLGDRHPYVATSMNNLALLYESQGKYEAAEPLFLDALQMWKELLGDRHPDMATNMNNLANLYKSQGKYEAAEPLYLDALQMRKELLGDRHPDVATSMNNLALLYKSQRKYAEAESLRLQCLEIQLETLGQEHPQTQVGFNNFAGLIIEVMKADALDQLSDHPITQQLLQQIQDQEK